MGSGYLDQQHDVCREPDPIMMFRVLGDQQVVQVVAESRPRRAVGHAPCACGSFSAASGAARSRRRRALHHQRTVPDNRTARCAARQPLARHPYLVAAAGRLGAKGCASARAGPCGRSPPGVSRRSPRVAAPVLCGARADLPTLVAAARNRPARRRLAADVDFGRGRRAPAAGLLQAACRDPRGRPDVAREPGPALVGLARPDVHGAAVGSDCRLHVAALPTTTATVASQVSPFLQQRRHLAAPPACRSSAG